MDGRIVAFGSEKVKPLFGSIVVAISSVGEECTIEIRKAYTDDTNYM